MVVANLKEELIDIIMNRETPRHLFFPKIKVQTKGEDNVGDVYEVISLSDSTTLASALKISSANLKLISDISLLSGTVRMNEETKKQSI